MSKNEIINRAIEIILKHAKPSRIWVIGSTSTGEASETSDIDISYEDPANQNIAAIKEDIEKIESLIKVDVSNITHAEMRFAERVRSSGKVVYSASKKLRAEDGLHNFKNSFSRFDEIICRKDEFFSQRLSDVYPDIVIQRFEFTFEMSWKALKRYLSFLGIEAANPRAVFKESYAQKLIHDEAIWLEMIENRNLSSHVYGIWQIEPVVQRAELYRDSFKLLLKTLEEKIV